LFAGLEQVIDNNFGGKFQLQSIMGGKMARPRMLREDSELGLEGGPGADVIKLFCARSFRQLAASPTT
jgi:hypothetical protein